jgi:methyl acetate hydrolase
MLRSPTVASEVKRMKRSILFAAAALVLVVAAPHAQLRTGDLDTLLREAVEQKRVPMVVAMIANGKAVVYEQAVGASKDAIFSIASMTKPVTAVAVMQLVDARRVKLDEPAATYLPELASVRVLDGGTLRVPKSPPTVRHLLSHTSGFGYEFMNKNLSALVAKKELPSMMTGGDAFLKAPLLFDPGLRWEYGISTDWLGRLVERVSGQSLEAYFREKIFDPLAMHDTFYNVPAEKRARVLAIYQRGADGTLTRQPPPPTQTVEFFSGGGGLFSTAADYMTFIRALLAGGQLNGRRILSTESVTAMERNQIGALELRPIDSLIPQMIVNGAVLPGSIDKFGLGVAINTKPSASGRGANTMTWAGLFNTFFWIDREKQVAAVLMSQMLPFLEPEAHKLLADFDRAVYQTGTR